MSRRLRLTSTHSRTRLLGRFGTDLVDRLPLKHRKIRWFVRLNNTSLFLMILLIIRLFYYILFKSLVSSLTLYNKFLFHFCDLHILYYSLWFLNYLQYCGVIFIDLYFSHLTFYTVIFYGSNFVSLFFHHVIHIFSHSSYILGSFSRSYTH